jgi:hypothetical protein
MRRRCREVRRQGDAPQKFNHRRHHERGPESASEKATIVTEIDLAFISRQLDRVLGEQRHMRDDLSNIKTRLTALESAFGLLITQIATLNGRLNRFEEQQLES